MHVGYHYDSGLSDYEISWAIAAPVSFVGLLIILGIMYRCGVFNRCRCYCADPEDVDYDFDNRSRKSGRGVRASIEEFEVEEFGDPDIVEKGSVKNRNSKSATFGSRDPPRQS